LKFSPREIRVKEKKKYPSRKSHKRLLKYGVVAVVVLVSAVLVFFFLFPPSSPYHPKTFYMRAAIVDQLNQNNPNPDFVQNATTTLQSAGFTQVDHITNADVNCFKNLAKGNYGIIIFRTHSGVYQNDVNFFTTEQLDSGHWQSEQWRDEVTQVRVSDDSPWYFGISPKFIQNLPSNEGFENTVIITMGCGGLEAGPPPCTSMAEAFVYKGAKAYFGWSKDVSSFHTDDGIQQFLQYLVKGNTFGISAASTPHDLSTGASYTLHPQDVSILKLGDLIALSQQSPESNLPTQETATGKASLCSTAVLSQDHKLTHKIRVYLPQL
jgi:hypothetical protein